MIDFAGIGGVAGVAAGAFDAACPADGTAVGADSEVTVTDGCLSGGAAAFAGAAVATGATAGAAVWVTGGSALAGDVDMADEGGPAKAVVEEAAGAEDSVEEDVGDDTGEEEATGEGWGEEGWGLACGEAAPAFCRAIEPVTESRPCSRTVMREYSRSRSPLRVSTADASRLVSFWPSLAIDWICCDCRARSTLAICSRRHPIED
jgi:hypothetical protein